MARAGEGGFFLEQLFGGGRGGDYVPNLLSDCTVYSSAKGFVLDRAIVINIIGCTVYQSSGYAYHLYNQSHSVSINGCRSFQIGSDAVVLETSNEVNLSGNIFCWQEGHGIVLKNARWGTVSANNVIDSGSINVFDPDKIPFVLKSDSRPFRAQPSAGQHDNKKNGIYLSDKSRGITITGNAIFNWPVALKLDHGIYEDSSCLNNLVTANNINYFVHDIVSQGEGTVVTNNVTFGDEPYAGKIGTDLLQYFDLRLMDEFVKNQMPG